jgi:ADP-ribose pyrophosphatase YjhB (NUDIX family)
MGKLYSTSVQIRDPRGNYLWIRRSSTAPSRAGEYEHPGGHAERGETAKEAARREIREETGIKIRDDELRLIERTTGPKGDHVTYSYTIRKAVRPKLSFEHDHFVWSPQAPALENGFFAKYMQGKDTSAMTTEQKAKGVAVGVGTKVVTRTAGKAIAKKMAARAAASAAVKVGTAGTGVGVFVTGGMMVADAAPEAWAVAKEADANRKQTWSEVQAAKGAGAKLKAAALGGGKGFLHMSTAPLRVGAASIFGSGTVKMAREAAGEAMAARKAKQNGVGAVVFKRGAQIVAQRAGKAVVQKGGKAVAQKGVLGGLRSAARQAPEFTAAIGSILKEAGKVVGIGAGVVGVSALAVQGVAGQIRGRPADKQAPSPAANKNPSSIAANVAEINKMLKNMPSDWQAQLSINRAELKAAGAKSSQLPPSRPNAHNILLALNLNNRGEVSSEAAAVQEQPSGKTVPDDVREAAMEGVRLSYQNNYGGYHLIGLGRAIQLAISPKISDAAFNRMRMYFNRKTKQDRLSDQYANKRGKRYWSWLNWGGDPGARWSRSKRFAELVKENPSQSPSQSPLHRFAAQYPHKFKVGVNPHGRVCLMVLDTAGQKTGQFCYSEDKAREIMARKSSPKEECQTCANAVPHVSSPSDKLPLLVPLLDDYLRLNTAPGKKAKTIKAFQNENEHLAILSAASPSPGAYEFVVDKQTQEVWRSDSHGRPQPHHNYGTMDNILRAGKLTTYRNPRF